MNSFCFPNKKIYGALERHFWRTVFVIFRGTGAAQKNE